MPAGYQKRPIRIRRTAEGDVMEAAAEIRMRRQRAVLILTWALLACLGLWRVLLGPWPPAIYRLVAGTLIYLFLRTGVVMRRDVPAWTEYAFLFLDAALVSAAVRLLGGIKTDFYLVYFLILAEGVLTLDLWAVVPLAAWVSLGYVAATWPAARDAGWPVVTARLFFVLLVSIGAAWIAFREVARGRVVASLHERLALEGERKRLAREIHDGIGHILAAGTQSLELAERLLPAEPERARELLPDVKALLRQGLDEIRVLVMGLRPAGPSVGDAVAAAREHLAALSARTQIRTELQSRAREIPLAPSCEFAFRRIIQEALTNIVRHAGASLVTITLNRDGAFVTCSIADDGAGLAPAPEERRLGAGLQHMRERAAELGGTFDIATAPGGGTTVTFTVPCLADAS